MEFLTDVNGRRPITTYEYDSSRNVITLTQQEVDLIALNNPGKRPPQALENLHAWLPVQKYLSNSDINYKTLLKLIRDYKQHFFTPNDYCNERWNTICNTLRMTSNLDARFYCAWHLPIQDTFVLEEVRPNRSVVAIDFNAMYATCMQFPFPGPSSMKKVVYGRALCADEALSIGIYRCRLGGDTSSFIRKHNPFRSFFAGRYLGTSLSEDVVVDLNEFEVDFYRRHFSHIYLIDAIISDRAISHPLAKEARRAFVRRKNYKAQKNKALADREKFMMTLMASSANRPGKETRSFKDLPEVLAFLHNYFGVRFHAGETVASVDTWLRGKKGISVLRGSSGFKVEFPSLNKASACFSLSQRIIARGRIFLLDKMEKISRITAELEICYCNIDSIHFSVPNTAIDNILSTLQAEANEEMGGYKVEAITKSGLWLEPGRYWLYTDIVEKFKNRGINDGSHPFKEHKIYVTNRLIGGLHIPIRATIDLAGSMSDLQKSVEDPFTGLVRLHLIEVTDETLYEEVLMQLDFNRRNAIPKKMYAFERLKKRLMSVP